MKSHEINKLLVFAFSRILNFFKLGCQYTAHLITIIKFTHAKFIIA